MDVCVLQVSGGTVTELLDGLRSVGKCKALSILEGALLRGIDQETKAANQKTGKPTTLEVVLEVQVYSVLCTSGCAQVSVAGEITTALSRLPVLLPQVRP